MSDIEIRSAIDNITVDDNKKIITGKAISFNVPEVVYKDRFGNEYREMISSNSIDKSILKDIPLKYNHDKFKANILARQRDNSLQLELRDDGLYFNAELRTNFGSDIYYAIKSGDINKCSFGFICGKDEYQNEKRTRIVSIIKKLTDISVVDNPAYKNTNVECRSNFYEEKAKETEQLYIAKQKLILLTYC